MIDDIFFYFAWECHATDRKEEQDNDANSFGQSRQEYSYLSAMVFNEKVYIFAFSHSIKGLF